MARASEEAADALHALTFQIVQEEIEGYRDRGEPVPPALLAQAIKLLKDNDINSPVRARKVADELAPHLPDFGPEDMVSGVPH
ncbi:hypothetical protein [Stenotrophomonas oahuensis]|uniref:Uncharacterized protein n=1 Tax=Stenotrophomonas oahuensis TaxID=3003271 RepID=A0ABY9YNE6_9GAMM|nr:hypothetical protein [Stenotrophomonas sp. A5586]WNH52419.1 hypothetical protein PDM29_19185 [Stenotrophomonas sp. A5586]